jgi:hypothetical protein
MEREPDVKMIVLTGEGVTMSDSAKEWRARWATRFADGGRNDDRGSSGSELGEGM